MKFDFFLKTKLMEMNPFINLALRVNTSEKIIDSYSEEYDIDVDDIINDVNNLSIANFVATQQQLESIEKEANQRIKASKLKREENLATLDGEFNSTSRQGRVGDCWLLAGVNSMLATDKGKEIINDLVKVDNDSQTASVTLPGVGKTYDVSFKEIKANIENATGDMDMRAIEIAAEKYAMENTVGKEKKYDLNANYLFTAFDLLAPPKSKINEHIYGEKDVSKALNKIQKSKGDIAASTNARIFDKEDKEKQNEAINKDLGAVILKNDADNSEESVLIESNHAYSITKVTSSHVYLINPWNSSETIRVDREPFEQRFIVSTVKLKK